MSTKFDHVSPSQILIKQLVILSFLLDSFSFVLQLAHELVELVLRSQDVWLVTATPLFLFRLAACLLRRICLLLLFLEPFLFISLTFSLFSKRNLFIKFLLRFHETFLGLEEEVDDGTPHNRVTQDAGSSREGPVWEWRVVLVLGCQLVRVTLVALGRRAVNHASALEHSDSEVALVTLQTPSFALLAVVLNAEMARKAPDAEVD